jgi:hypothetical protein
LVERHGTRATDDDVLQEQVVDSRAEEGFQSLARGVDDRLALDVETGVEDHFTPGDSAHRLQERMELRVIKRGDGLHSSRAIDMRDGR